MEGVVVQLNRPFATVTPTLDGDVLGVLASADVTFTISQIRRVVTTASGEGIRKVLARLAIQGVVLHERVGRTSTYRLNTEHLAAQPIIALSRLVSVFLQRLEAHFESWGDELKYAAVYGSAATGRMKLDSDIDLFLVRASVFDTVAHNVSLDRWQGQVTELARLVTAWTGNDARVVEYDDDELRSAAIAGESLLHEVSQQGLTVAGTRAWFNKQLTPALKTAPMRRL